MIACATSHDKLTRRFAFALACCSCAGITCIYGRTRTRRLSGVQVHPVHRDGRDPYGSDGFVFGKFLRGELARSRLMLELYLAQLPGMKRQLEAYRADNFRWML